MKVVRLKERKWSCLHTKSEKQWCVRCAELPEPQLTFRKVCKKCNEAFNVTTTPSDMFGEALVWPPKRTACAHDAWVRLEEFDQAGQHIYATHKK